MSINHKNYHEDKSEPKRGVEPASSRLPAERLTTRPSRLTADTGQTWKAFELGPADSYLSESATIPVTRERNLHH